MAPAKTKPGLRICTLARTVSAELVEDAVIGEWGRRAEPFFGPSVTGGWLIQEFLNWSGDPAGVLRFTKRYGPLCDLSPEPGPFRMELSGWLALQEVYRIAWRGIAEGGKQSFRNGIWNAPVEAGDRLLARNGEVLYLTHTLSWFVGLEACLLPLDRLRICSRPDCETPYFVAGHLRQNYCSEVCAQWGQRKAKLKWWAEQGQEWREEHKRTKG